MRCWAPVATSLLLDLFDSGITFRASRSGLMSNDWNFTQIAGPDGLGGRQPGAQSSIGQDQLAADEVQLLGQVNQQRSERVLVGLERNGLRLHDGNLLI